jgi:hypothetical protein
VEPVLLTAVVAAAEAEEMVQGVLGKMVMLQAQPAQAAPAH